jgi:hypothetical protein
MTVIKTSTGLVNTLDGDPDDKPTVNVKALADAAALAGLSGSKPAPAAGTAAGKPAPKAKAGPKPAKAPKAKPAASPFPPAAMVKPKRVKAPTGGAREGAGRKPLDGKAAMHTVSFKCSEAQHKTFRGIPEGGAAWIRRGLDQYADYLKAGGKA